MTDRERAGQVARWWYSDTTCYGSDDEAEKVLANRILAAMNEARLEEAKWWKAHSWDHPFNCRCHKRIAELETAKKEKP